MNSAVAVVVVQRGRPLDLETKIFCTARIGAMDCVIAEANL
jgi:hypothetical protein